MIELKISNSYFRNSDTDKQIFLVWIIQSHGNAA